jgi:hypothetical protein
MCGRKPARGLWLALLGSGLACARPVDVDPVRRNIDYACAKEPHDMLAPPTPAPAVGTADAHRRARPATLKPADDVRPASTGRVLIVSVDGLRPDALFQAPAPHLLELACRGSYSWKAQTITPSMTVPGHASMVSGFLPEQHGLFNDDLRPGYSAAPTVMAVAKAAGKRVVMVVGKEKLVQLAQPGSTDVYVLAGGDQEVINQAVLQASVGFDLMFIHLPLVDLTGHASGWMSSSYLGQVAATDLALGRLLDAVGPDVTVIVSADHGGFDFVHWTGAPEDWQIPWIAAGPGIRSGHPLATAISTVDTAATAAAVLGLTLDEGAAGQPVEEAFSP